jgi:methylmalonyl-CoA mutase
MRTSEAFEALRDASDTMLAKSGQRPRIFLANIGPVAAFTARNQFAKNLFEAGGIETFGDTPHPDLDALMKAFKAASCTMACLCSSDALYAEQGIAVTQALKAAGAHHIYLAGRPADMEQVFHEAGVDGFISVGMDVLAFLQSLHRVAGVS